jgi:hypothetical protein
MNEIPMNKWNAQITQAQSLAVVWDRFQQFCRPDLLPTTTEERTLVKVVPPQRPIIIIYCVCMNGSCTNKWEKDYKGWLSWRYKVYHVSASNFTTLEDPVKDCLMKSCLKHYSEYHGDGRWMLYVNDDIYVNIQVLEPLMWDLGTLASPLMKSTARYGCHIPRNGSDYIELESGFLFSNFLVRTLTKHLELITECNGFYLRKMLDTLEIPFYEGCSDKFVNQSYIGNAK